MSKTAFEVGEVVSGFAVNRIVALPDLQATLYRLRHDRTGAELIHFENDDDNNLFSVAFRTTPKDSTGVAHILEHTVLCGSEKYPVKDPFFSMLERSLNTFMNAFTSNDWTMYPFSTQNKKDFYNLMDVYLDAVFFPRLEYKSFEQEGWRLEFSVPSDPKSELVYKGVVYNEMKGAMSDPNSLMSRRVQKALYPTTTYHYNSGGEPEDIPNLTWEKLKEFHARYYHPSNSRFFTYGGLPLERHLKIIDESVLSRFEAVHPDTSVNDEIRFAEPKREEFTYPFDPSASEEQLSKKSMVSVAWLTCNIRNDFEAFTMNVLSSLLLGNPGAPLYKALMDSGIGSALAPGTGYSHDNLDTYFSAGLQGVDPVDVDDIEKLILSTLTRVAEEGFTKERIEAVIHQVEFSNKEVVGDNFPYALNILFRIFGGWLHGGDPAKPLLINENLERLRREIDGGAYFEKKIREYMLDNNHRVTVLLRPDREKASRDAARERERLERLKELLSGEEREAIMRNTHSIAKGRGPKDDISCLPTLELSDIPVEERKVSFESGEVEGVPVQWYDQPTNGISYFNAIVSTASVPDELKPYIPLFCAVLTKIGAAGYDYAEMAERIEAHTGGINAGANVWESLVNLDLYGEVVEFSAKALARKHKALFEVLGDIFKSPDFRDLKRLHTLIGQIKTSMENSIPASGHSYARGLAARHLTPAARLRESWAGIHQLLLVKKIAACNEEGLKEVAERLEKIASHLLNKRLIRACVVAEARHFDSMCDAMGPFFSSISTIDVNPREPEVLACSGEAEGWGMNLPVSYVARVFRTVSYCHGDSPKLQVLAKLLRARYLHREIREKGGAYGGFAAYSSAEGLFSFLSYRDPNLERTLKVYSDSIEWVSKCDFSDEDLKEAILAVFGDIDRPLSPSGKGNREFVANLRGLTKEMRQRRREGILCVSRDDMVEVSEKYLQSNPDKSSVAVISGEERLAEASRRLEDLSLHINKI